MCVAPRAATWAPPPLPRARGLVVPTATFFGVPYSNYDYSNDRAALISRLHEFEAERAGLEARWQELEESFRGDAADTEATVEAASCKTR